MFFESYLEAILYANRWFMPNLRCSSECFYYFSNSIQSFDVEKYAKAVDPVVRLALFVNEEVAGLDIPEKAILNHNELKTKVQLLIKDMIEPEKDWVKISEDINGVCLLLDKLVVIAA